jgi:flagellar M-ring protein FliF
LKPRGTAADTRKQMDKYQQQAQAFWKSLSAKQKLVLAGSVALVGLIVWGFSVFMSSGDYKQLYTGLAPADAQQMTQRLASQNIQFRLSPDGTSILVAPDQLDRARVELAQQAPPSTGRLGFELFDKPNWSGSDFSEKVNYQRALEAELERTIETMSGIESARVHLVLPHDSLFTERERPAKAAVVVKLRGSRLNSELTGSIANLVSSAWDDLTPQNVTVVTTDGALANNGSLGSENGGMAMQDAETAMAERVVQVLAPIVGVDHVKSSVSLEYDQTSGESTLETYDPNASVVLSSQTSQENSGGAEPAGIPGTPSNTPSATGSTTAAQAKATAESQSGIHTENKTFAVSRTTKHTVEPAGRIKRIAAAVLVDDAAETSTANGKTTTTHHKRTPEEMKQIQDIASAALGIDSTRGDQLTVQNIAFQQVAVEEPPAPALSNKVLVQVDRWMPELRYAGLLAIFFVVYLFILKPVKKQVVAILETPIRPLPGVRAPALASSSAEGILEATPVAGLDEVSAAISPTPDIAKAVQLKRQLATKVKSDPQSASRLVENWIRQKGEQA